MIAIVTVGLLVSLATIVLLLVWLVRPARFYSFRDAVRAVRAGELGRKRKEQIGSESEHSEEWRRILREPRLRSGGTSISEVRRRVYDIREQYFLTDSIDQTRLRDDESDKPLNLGLLELSDLIVDLSTKLRADGSNVAQIVEVEDILADLARRLYTREMRLSTPKDPSRFLGVADRYQWLLDPNTESNAMAFFAEFPLCIEQSIELLAAVTVLLSLRLEEQNSAHSHRSTTSP